MDENHRSWPLDDISKLRLSSSVLVFTSCCNNRVATLFSFLKGTTLWATCRSRTGLIPHWKCGAIPTRRMLHLRWTRTWYTEWDPLIKSLTPGVVYSSFELSARIELALFWVTNPVHHHLCVESKFKLLEAIGSHQWQPFTVNSASQPYLHIYLTFYA